MPAFHPIFVIPADKGSSTHHASFTSATGTKEAHDIAVMVGKTLALLGSDLLQDGEFLKAVKADWADKVAASSNST